MKKKYIKVMCVILVTVLTGCSIDVKKGNVNINVSNEDTKSEIEYVGATVERGDVTQTISLDCNYMELTSQDLFYEKDDQRILNVYYEQGDTVKKGDVIIEYDVEQQKRDSRELIYELEYCKTLLKFEEEILQLELQKIKEEYTYSLIKTKQMNENIDLKETYIQNIEDIKESHNSTINYCKDTIRIDENKLSTYEKEIAESKLCAQIDGTIVSMKNNMKGSVTVANQVLATIINDSVSTFQCKNMEYANYFDKNTPVIISIGVAKIGYEAYPYHTEEWKDCMYFHLSDDTVQFASGARGNIYIKLKEIKDTLFVKKDMIYTITGDKHFVYKLNENGLRSIQYVEIGLEGDDTIEIISGLSEGDYIIY